jgi:hypothetical protein
VPVHEQHIVAPRVCRVLVCVCAADRRHLLSLSGLIDVIGCDAWACIPGVSGQVSRQQLTTVAVAPAARTAMVAVDRAAIARRPETRLADGHRSISAATPRPPGMPGRT